MLTSNVGDHRSCLMYFFFIRDGTTNHDLFLLLVATFNDNCITIFVKYIIEYCLLLLGYRKNFSSHMFGLNISPSDCRSFKLKALVYYYVSVRLSFSVKILDFYFFSESSFLYQQIQIKCL